MAKIRATFSMPIAGEEGATMVEYALMIAFIEARWRPVATSHTFTSPPEGCPFDADVPLPTAMSLLSGLNDAEKTAPE